IPTAFIVNGEGKVAWIGHPQEMDQPLDEIVAGKYDLAAAITKHKEAIVQKRKLNALRDKLLKARQSGDPKEVLAVIDQAITDDAGMEARLGMMKFQLLSTQADNQAKILEYATHLAEKVFKDNAQGLNAIAWTIVDPESKAKPDAKLIKVALQAAQRADE